MELMEAIKGRRSIRSYKKQSVEDQKVKKILEAAHSAPSAANYQPWYFIVVRDPGKKRKFTQCFSNEVTKYLKTLNKTWQERFKSFSTEFVFNAPLLIVICSNPHKSKPGEPGRGLHVLGACAAIQNLMLAAYGEGLGTVWITRYNHSEVRAIFNIPSKVVPVGVIPVGYPDEAPEKSAFAAFGWVLDEPLSDHIFVEQWGRRGDYYS